MNIRNKYLLKILKTWKTEDLKRNKNIEKHGKEDSEAIEKEEEEWKKEIQWKMFYRGYLTNAKGI